MIIAALIGHFTGLNGVILRAVQVFAEFALGLNASLGALKALGGFVQAVGGFFLRSLIVPIVEAIAEFLGVSGALVGGVVAIVAGVALAVWYFWDDIVAGAEWVWNGLKTIFSAIGGIFMAPINAAKKAFQDFWGWLTSSAEKTIYNIRKMFGLLKPGELAPDQKPAAAASSGAAESAPEAPAAIGDAAAPAAQDGPGKIKGLIDRAKGIDYRGLLDRADNVLPRVELPKTDFARQADDSEASQQEGAAEGGEAKNPQPETGQGEQDSVREDKFESAKQTVIFNFPGGGNAALEGKEDQVKALYEHLRQYLTSARAPALRGAEY